MFKRKQEEEEKEEEEKAIRILLTLQSMFQECCDGRIKYLHKTSLKITELHKCQVTVIYKLPTYSPRPPVIHVSLAREVEKGLKRTKLAVIISTSSA